jgi:hypothetical protein
MYMIIRFFLSRYEKMGKLSCKFHFAERKEVYSALVKEIKDTLVGE